jgi:hypothetical protein
MGLAPSDVAGLVRGATVGSALGTVSVVALFSDMSLGLTWPE